MYKLSPSDFAYLYQDCKHCYYQKIKNGIILPSMPMPGVFSAINALVQSNYVGKKLKTLASDLPDGEVVSQEGFVESILIPGTSVFIKGKYDLLVKNPDGTYTVVDFKISKPGEDKIEKYKTQLGAYKFALENPKADTPIKISRLALLMLFPNKTHFDNGAILHFPHTWLDIPIDNAGFLKFMKEVDSVLSGPEPKMSETCKWCLYRKSYEPQIKVAIDSIVK
jgi:hypothetical protein